MLRNKSSSTISNGIGGANAGVAAAIVNTMGSSLKSGSSKRIDGSKSGSNPLNRGGSSSNGSGNKKKYPIKMSVE
jgi:hypothetical protein